MKNFFNVATAIAMTAPFAGAIAADNSDIAAKLQQLEAIVQQQQAEIAALRGEVAPNRALVADLVQEELDARLDSRIQEGLAAIKDSGTLSLGMGIDGLKLTGDLRLRYARSEASTGAEDDWYESRLRIGGAWTNKAEDWTVAAGIEVGNVGGRNADAIPSAGVFNNNPVILDYAYAAHTMDAFTLVLGQMKNPFVTSGMLWDEDVRPVGVGVAFADAGFFATTGVVVLNQAVGGGDAEALVSAAQVGFKSDGEDANYTVALGYWHGNGETATDIATGAGYDIQILDVIGKFNTTAGDVGLGIWGHYAINFGADGAAGTGQVGIGGQKPEDNDQAYAIGVTASLDKFSAGYTWKHIEADAVVAAFNDDEFALAPLGAGGTSNVEGHEVSLGYAATENVSLGLRGLFVEQIEGALDRDAYYIDVTYKF